VWSIEQTSLWFAGNREWGISHQWIDRPVRNGRESGGALHQSLRRRNRYGRPAPVFPQRPRPDRHHHPATGPRPQQLNNRPRNASA